MNVANKGLSWDTKMTCEIIWSLVVRWVVLMGSLILRFILLLRWNVHVNYFQSGPHRCSCCQTSYLVPGRCSTVHRGTVLTSCLVFCRPARPCSVSTENMLPTRVKMTAFSFNRRYHGKSSGKINFTFMILTTDHLPCSPYWASITAHKLKELDFDHFWGFLPQENKDRDRVKFELETVWIKCSFHLQVMAGCQWPHNHHVLERAGNTYSWQIRNEPCRDTHATFFS